MPLGIIVLFIWVGIHPAFAVDAKQSMVNKADEEDCDCKEIDNRHLVVLEKQLNRLEVNSKLLLVLSKHQPELKEISEDLSNQISTLKEELTYEPFPIICAIIEPIWYHIWYIIDILDDLAKKYEDNPIIHSIIFYFLQLPFAYISGPIIFIGVILKCDFAPPD